MNVDKEIMGCLMQKKQKRCNFFISLRLRRRGEASASRWGRTKVTALWTPRRDTDVMVAVGSTQHQSDWWSGWMGLMVVVVVVQQWWVDDETVTQKTVSQWDQQPGYDWLWWTITLFCRTWRLLIKDASAAPCLLTWTGSGLGQDWVRTGSTLVKV